MPWRSWTAGENVPAATVQSHLQDQCVLIFASASARDAAIPTASRVAGMVAYTAADDTHWVWTGTAWRRLMDTSATSVLTSDVSNSTTTLVDSGLAITLPASSRWAIDVRLWLDAQPSDGTFTIVGPTGASGLWSPWPDRPAGGSVTNASRAVALASTLNLELQFNGPGTSGLYSLLATVLIGSTAGDVKVRFAALSAGATVLVRAGSVMTATRLA